MKRLSLLSLLFLFILHVCAQEGLDVNGVRDVTLDSGIAPK